MWKELIKLKWLKELRKFVRTKKMLLLKKSKLMILKLLMKWKGSK